MTEYLKLYHNENWLRNEYVNKAKSTRMIAKKCGCSNGAIARFIKKFRKIVKR